MKVLNAIMQGIKDGQRQTRWHKWFLLAITPSSFAYCALFPFSPETGPSTGHILGFLPVVVGSLGWAFFKTEPQCLSVLLSIFPKKLAKKDQKGAVLEDLHVRVELDVKSVELLVKENQLRLSSIKKGRLELLDIRRNCIKMRPAFQKHGLAEQVWETVQLQERVEQSLREWNDLEKRVLASSTRIHKLRNELDDVKRMIEMQTLISDLKTLSAQTATIERKQKDITFGYRNLHQQKAALA